MPASTSTAARYFPHDPNFISATDLGGGRVNYGYKLFTGAEQEPVPPSYSDKNAALEQQPADEQAIEAEFNERFAEYEVMYKLWREASYRKQLTPLITAAVEARPVVDATLCELDEAWTGLDTAAVWPVAVKRVLDAHDAAHAAMEQWTYQHAEPLATAESKYPETIADWQGLARQLGHEAGWDIGWYFRDRYNASPLDEVNDKITKQRRRLEEIAQFSKQDN